MQRKFKFACVLFGALVLAFYDVLHTMYFYYVVNVLELILDVKYQMLDIRYWILEM